MRLPRGLGAALATLALVAAPAAGAETPPSGQERIGLGQAVLLALEESHLMRAARLGEEKALVALERARAERYLTKSELTVEAGFVPEARGTVVDSPDSSDDLDALGPFYRVNLEFLQPLYTFGRLRNLEETALRGVEFEKARTTVTRQELVALVVAVYHGLSASREGEELGRRLKKDYSTLLGEVRERLEDPDSEVDDVDLLEVLAAAYRIDKGFLDARQNRRQSQRALSALLGRDFREAIVTADEPVPRLAVGEEALQGYLEGDRWRPPQLEAVEAGARALEAKIALERSDRYPVIFLAGGAGYAQAANRDEQDNPFVGDEYNYTRLGAGIGMAWNPFVRKKNLAVEEQQKEHHALVESGAALRRKLTVEALDQLGEAGKNAELLESARTSLAAAKKRLRLTLDNWELGLGDVQRVIDAYEDYYQLEGTVVERRLELLLSLASLASSTGDVERYLEWVQSGEVRL